MLKLGNITKDFGGLRALNNISLCIRQGELIGLIGPNGSGKSTLFNVNSGFLKPDSGHIKFLDDDITGLPHIKSTVKESPEPFRLSGHFYT